MQNKFLPILSLLLFSCSGGCGGDKLPPAPPPPPPIEEELVDASFDPAELEFSNADYSFTLPNESWKQEKPELQSISVYFSSSKDQGAFLSSKEAFSGSQEEFSLLSVRTVKNSGMNVMTYSTQELNKVKFNTILANKDTSLFWLWLRVYKGQAFTFGCKTENLPEDKSAAICSLIASTIRFN